MPLVGATPPHAGQPNTPASGSHGPASGSQSAWVPPEPAGPPPKQVSVVIDLTEPRRTTVSAGAYQMAKAFSGTLHASTGSVTIGTIHTVAQTEIASNIDGDETVPIDHVDLETT